MKINLINNNNQPQNRQQSFGAIAGKNFKTTLHSMFTDCYGPEAKETFEILNSKEAITAFAQSFDEIRIRPLYYDINPVVNLRDNHNGSYTLGLDALGIMSKQTTLYKDDLLMPPDVLAEKRLSKIIAPKARQKPTILDTILYLSKLFASELEETIAKTTSREKIERATRKSEHDILHSAPSPQFTFTVTVNDGLENLMKLLRYKAPDEQVRPRRGAYED